MSEQGPRNIKSTIEHISNLFSECARTNTADIQNNEFTQAERDLEASILLSQSLQDKIVFTAGDEPVETAGFVRVHNKTIARPPLEPGKSIYLTRAVYAESGVPRLYVGNRSLLIATTGLAQALTQSAKLELQTRRHLWQIS